LESKGINVNYAPKEVLMSMAPTMSEEAVAEILARRSDPNIGGPFVDDNDFLGFLESQRVDTQPIRDSNLPLYYGTVFNFRVTSTGVYSNVTREIEVIVYDFDNLKERYIEIVNKEEAEKNRPTKMSKKTKTIIAIKMRLKVRMETARVEALLVAK
jgi:hypothetical protein